MLSYALFAALAFADPAVVFESGASRPLALSEDGSRLFVANLPDGRLDQLDPRTGDLVATLPVGLDPVAVAVRGEQAWVVEQLSDSVSVVDLSAASPRIIATLHVGDEPGDVVIAGDRAFVTAAHRGRGLLTSPQSELPSIPRADVWVFDRTTDPPHLDKVIRLFGDSPRALAVSPDASTVYAAVFRSGNRTAVVPQHIVCDGGAAAGPCTVDGYQLPGGIPGPNVDAEGRFQPEVGLIVRNDGGAWRDELGRDWSEGIRFELPDTDVFALDAASLVEVESWSGVGTVLYAMDVAADGELLVANTEAINEVRFAGLGLWGGPTVRGHLHEARITRVGASQLPVPIRLNPHIDYDLVPSPPDVEAASLAQPVALDIGPEGQVWIAGYGSAAIAIVDLDELRAGLPTATADRLVPTLPGPAGVWIDAASRVVFVYSRFDNAVQAFDLDTRQEIWQTRLHSPESPEIATGRALFFDAHTGSSNGEASCGVCHVFGHDDGLAWDLGDPDGVTVSNPNPIREGDVSLALDFHPLKGPMRTQTLRGIADNGPLHWRGDRADFTAFGEAFEGLLGEDAPADPALMVAMSAWALAIDPPPNPYLPIDGVRTAEQEAGWQLFLNADCVECHAFDPSQGHWGTDGFVAANSNAVQFMKIPSLRQAYTKLGLYWTGSEPRIVGPGDPLGPQVTAYGWFHDGAVGSLPPGVEPAILAFPSNHAPAVGDHLTLRRDDDGTTRAAVDGLIARADAGDCDLVAHTAARGWLWDGALWQPDAGSAAVTPEGFVVLAPLSFLCAPVGLGERLALDRDWDGVRNGDDNCEAIENPDQRDTDGDGMGDPCDIGDPEEPGPTTRDPPEPAGASKATSGCGCATHGGGPFHPAFLLGIALLFRRETGRAASFPE